MNYISSYCHINNKIAGFDGKVIFKGEPSSTEDWTKQLYKNLQVDYPKFYKMDVLSKYAFLATEILKTNDSAINSYSDDGIALLFSNSRSSADADIKFQNSYLHEEAPSPALFVYTLPNILIGEIAIRNKWYGENLFFITEKFDASFFVNYCNILLEGKSKSCLCGWIDAVNNEADVFLFFVEATNHKDMPLTIQNLNNLYKT